MRYEMRGFNSLLGSHYDHYYLDYDWYSSDTPSSDVFKITESMCVCKIIRFFTIAIYHKSYEFFYYDDTTFISSLVI